MPCPGKVKVKLALTCPPEASGRGFSAFILEDGAQALRVSLSGLPSECVPAQSWGRLLPLAIELFGQRPEAVPHPAIKHPLAFAL